MIVSDYGCLGHSNKVLLRLHHVFHRDMLQEMALGIQTVALRNLMSNKDAASFSASIVYLSVAPRRHGTAMQCRY
jgi:hypothetical protein